MSGTVGGRSGDPHPETRVKYRLSGYEKALRYRVYHLIAWIETLNHLSGKLSKIKLKTKIGFPKNLTSLRKELDYELLCRDSVAYYKFKYKSYRIQLRTVSEVETWYSKL